MWANNTLINRWGVPLIFGGGEKWSDNWDNLLYVSNENGAYLQLDGELCGGKNFYVEIKAANINPGNIMGQQTPALYLTANDDLQSVTFFSGEEDICGYFNLVDLHTYRLQTYIEGIQQRRKLYVDGMEYVGASVNNVISKINIYNIFNNIPTINNFDLYEIQCQKTLTGYIYDLKPYKCVGEYKDDFTGLTYTVGTIAFIDFEKHVILKSANNKNFTPHELL